MCEYCDKLHGNKRILKNRDGDLELFISSGYLYVFASRVSWMAKKANYCPVCGRKLVKE